MTYDSYYPCFYLLWAGIRVVCHHALLIQNWRLNQGLMHAKQTLSCLSRIPSPSFIVLNTAVQKHSLDILLVGMLLRELGLKPQAWMLIRQSMCRWLDKTIIASISHRVPSLMPGTMAFHYTKLKENLRIHGRKKGCEKYLEPSLVTL